MRMLVSFFLALSFWVGLPAPGPAADGPVKRLLYVTSRDGAGGKGGKGIYVYDIDRGHKLVKFIDMPRLGGTRGACTRPPPTGCGSLTATTRSSAWT